VAEKHRLILDQRHPRSQAGKGLRELAPHRTAADDQEPLRTLGHVKHVLVGQVPRFFQSWNRRAYGQGTRRHQGLLEVEHLGADRHGTGTGKAGGAEVHIDAHRGQPLLRICFGQARANSLHALHDRREVHDDRSGDLAAEAFGIAHLPVQPGCTNERLGRDTALVQARAPQEIALDERDPRAVAYGYLRGKKTRRPRPDDQHVVGTSGTGVAP